MRQLHREPLPARPGPQPGGDPIRARHPGQQQPVDPAGATQRPATKMAPCRVRTVRCSASGTVPTAEVVAEYSSNTAATSISATPSTRATPTAGRPHGKAALIAYGRSPGASRFALMRVEPPRDHPGKDTRAPTILAVAAPISCSTSRSAPTIPEVTPAVVVIGPSCT
jgi:hypothetical protein